MNERIKELKTQSLVCKNGNWDYDMEKFAELIVRECGQYLNSPEFIGRSDLDWAMVLNKHFGVEE
jgi:predicted transcriptional regulator